MERHDVGRLEERITEVRERLTAIIEDDSFLELIKIIHNPGWTTPAEFRLVTTVVEAIDQQVRVIERLKVELLEGSRLVGQTEHAAV